MMDALYDTRQSPRKSDCFALNRQSSIIYDHVFYNGSPLASVKWLQVFMGYLST